MSIKIGINGFGRIGRMVVRRAIHHPEIEVVGINDLCPADYLAYMLKYDTMHGKFDGEVKAEENAIIINGKRIPVSAERDPHNLPWKELGELCQSRNICMIADGAQACGILPVSMSNGINILCTAGHKGLYGITGTGVLLTDGAFPLYPLMQGGTGSASASPDQPDFLPDRLESGTLNIIGAASLKAGIEFVQRQPMERLLQKESRLCTVFCSLLESDPAIRLYREPGVSYVPIVSFNGVDIPPEELAAVLGEQGFCLRAGLHCSPLAHQTLGTPDGTVRFAPSAFSRESDVIRLADAVKKSVRMLKK